MAENEKGTKYCCFTLAVWKSGFAHNPNKPKKKYPPSDYPECIYWGTQAITFAMISAPYDFVEVEGELVTYAEKLKVGTETTMITTTKVRVINYKILNHDPRNPDYPRGGGNSGGYNSGDTLFQDDPFPEDLGAGAENF